MSNANILPQPRIFSPPTNGKSIQVDGKYYSIGNLLGNGHFGSVYECSDEWGNHLVAKVLMPKNQTYEDVREGWLEELNKLVTLRHPNITYIHTAFEYEDTFYIVIERCSMTLDVLITTQGLKPDNWIPYVARDVLQGLEYIHSSGYVHKDIHPGNVFVSQSQDRMVPTKDAVWSFKIGDLGISRLETEINALNTILALWMLPPEAINPSEFGQVGRAVDVYHVGLLLLAIALKRIPTFSQQEIVAGVPRQLAEMSPTRYGKAIGCALRRHTQSRPTAIEFWRAINAATTSTP
jgi:serine/threonine-protein kinase